MKDLNTGYDAENHDPHIETRMEGDAPTPATVEEAAKECANKKHGFDGQIAPIGSKHRAEWENTVTDFIAGHSHKGEGWVSVKEGNLPEPWTPCLVYCQGRYGQLEGVFVAATIHIDSVDKQVRGLDPYKRGIYYITHYMLLPQPPKTDK